MWLSSLYSVQLAIHAIWQTVLLTKQQQPADRLASHANTAMQSRNRNSLLWDPNFLSLSLYSSSLCFCSP